MTERKSRQYWAILRAALVVILLACVAGFGQVAMAQDSASSEGYRALWKRGEYSRALNKLQTRMAQYKNNRVPVQMLFHHGELLFATGQVDEAIEAYKEACDRNPEPEYLLALAEAEQYRGQPLYYENTLRRASGLVRGRRWAFSIRPRNLVAVGRIHELNGENPKTLLNAYYQQVFDRYPNSADAYIGAAELSYRYAGWAMAAKHFTKALELDESNPDALAGLCETYRKSSDPRLEDVLTRLEEVNPNHPRLLRLKAALMLDLGQVDEAMELIEQGLAINANDLHLRSLKAGAHFLEDDDAAVEETIQGVLEFNPLWSGVYRETGRVAARHYRFQEAMELQEKALEIVPADWEARSEYTLNLMRLGREEQGREELEKAFDQHPYSVTLYNLLQLMDTLAEFEVIETDDFILKIPKSEAPVLADDALALLEDALERWESDYKYTVERPVLIEMFDNHDDFMVRSVGLPGSAGHLGICFGKLVTMDTPSVRAPGSTNWRLVLWHEFSHVVALQKTKNRVERWLTEGISGYEETRYSPAWNTHLDPNYIQIVATEPIPKVEEITNYFIAPKSGGHMMFGYFTSAQFVSFYVEQYGFETLADALHLIGEKRSTVEALTEAAGVDLKVLNEGFTTYFEKVIAPYENLPQPQTEEEPGLIEQLADLLPLGDDDEEQHAAHGSDEAPFTKALERGRVAAEAGYTDAAVEAYEEAHALFPGYRGNDAPLRRLARLYESEGRDEEWLETNRRMIDWTPTEVGAAKNLMTHYEQQEDWEGTRRMAELAMGIDPYNVNVRESLVRSARALGDVDGALRQLDIVEHLDPARAGEHRLLRAELLEEAERWDESKHEVVRLLETFPHYWEAQQLLLRLVETERSATGEVEPLGYVE